MNKNRQLPDVDNLIYNLDFVEWVISPNKESDLYWTRYISDYQSRKKEIDEAIFIIRKLIPLEKELTDKDIQNLWNRIEQEAKAKNNRTHRFFVSPWKVAAGIFLVAGLSTLIYYQFLRVNPVEIYQSIARVESPQNEVKLIFADKSEAVLGSNNPEIKYNNKGELQINSDNQTSKKNVSATDETEQLNQLVVPNGKRTSLILSDGSKLWLNSGSRTIFPVLFSKAKREIYLEGEAYLEVAHDISRPFYVVTNNVRIRVLGTMFNVSAYPEDKETSVVLVDGSVQAVVDDKTTLMKPNQLFTYQKQTKETSLKETNVIPFISWKDGWMYCEKEKLSVIATKLSRYYNVPIEFEDEKSKDMTLTGKLDLKSECSAIIDAISRTAPIVYAKNDNKILIKSKQ